MAITPGGVAAAVRARSTQIAPGAVGLNFDPSHLVWQFIDCARAVREFGTHIVHVHAKDERIDQRNSTSAA